MQIRHEHAFRALADPASAIRKRRKKLIAAALAAKVPPTAEEEAERKRKAEKAEREKARAERHAKRRAAAGLAARRGGEEEETKEKEIVGEMKEEVEELGDEGILVLTPEGNALDVLGVTREVAAMLSVAQQRAKPEGTTERKIRVKAIGHVQGSYWDDIFLITTLHHHVSVSHLRVSQPYLRFLRTGKLPNKEHPFIKEGGWEKLHLRKTRYWSMMVPAERVEAARAVVTVLKWLTRDQRK